MKSIWDATDTAEMLARIEKLSPATRPLWGKMSAGQMLAHCNVSYELAYTDKHPKPNAFLKIILKLLVKNAVVNEKPYKRNTATGPQFLIKETRDFEVEKRRLIDHVHKTRDLGEAHFHGRASHSFGPLTGKEWNNMFYKHLDHHLSQFGA
ncbi:MAG TPA: DUF1569 domain-containing protein [Fibrobacteria bacterium]|nr:DUF1569 domain-containing protein [Fibrobacteria bacterium]